MHCFRGPEPKGSIIFIRRGGRFYKKRRKRAVKLIFTSISKFLRKNNNAHFAVHSLKDLPTEIDSELCLGAIPGLYQCFHF